MPASLNKVSENYSSHEAPANSPLGQKFRVSMYVFKLFVEMFVGKLMLLIGPALSKKEQKR